MSAEPPRSRPSSGLGAMALLALAVVGALVVVARSLDRQVRSRLAPPPAVAAAPVTPLIAAGLRDNPDWEQLPGLFGVWADHAEWHDHRTRFAYWNPGARAYTYFFEATRGPDGRYRFREISRPPEMAGLYPSDLPQVDEHPLYFLRSAPPPEALPVVTVGDHAQQPLLAPTAAQHAPVDLPRTRLQPDAPALPPPAPPAPPPRK